MSEKKAKLLALIREALEYNESNNNKVELYENDLLTAGFTKQQIAFGLGKLADEGVIELQQIFFAPERTLSNYEPESETKYKVPADSFYKNPVYVLHINRGKLESLPSIGAVRFVDNEAIIYFGDAKVELPPHRGEHALCRAMFRYPTNEPVSWDVVYEESTGENLTGDDKSDKRKKRKIYDASEAINKRIKEETGIDKMFVWQGTTIKRTR